MKTFGCNCILQIRVWFFPTSSFTQWLHLQILGVYLGEHHSVAQLTCVVSCFVRSAPIRFVASPANHCRRNQKERALSALPYMQFVTNCLGGRDRGETEGGRERGRERGGVRGRKEGGTERRGEEEKGKNEAEHW